MKPFKQPGVRTAMFLIVFGVFVYSVFDTPGRYGNAISWLSKVFGTIIWGFALAFLLNLIMSPVEKLIKLIESRKKKLKLKPGAIRGLSLLITAVISLGAVSLMLGTIIPAVISIVETVIAILPGVTESVGKWLTETVPGLLPGLEDGQELGAKLSSLLTDGSQSIVSYLTNFMSSYGSFALEFTAGLFGGLANIILTVAFSLYALAAKEAVCASAHKLCEAYLPEKVSSFCFDIARLADEKFSLFFRGQVVEAVILGTLCFVGMLIFGFPNAGLISILMAVTAIVPVAGPWLGTITSVLLVVISNPLQGLFFGIYIALLQQIEDNVIYPRVVGKSIGLPGLLVLFAVIVGVKSAGMVGIIVGVPLCAVVFELLKTYTGRRLAVRETDNADAD